MRKSTRRSLSTIGAIKVDRSTKRKQKALADSRKLSSTANDVCVCVCVYGASYFFPPGIRPRWIKSLLISREAHSPIPDPSSFRLLGSPLYSLSICLPSSFAPASSHYPRPPLPPQSRPASLSPTVSPSFLFFFSEFSSMFSAPHEKLALPAETNSTFLLILLLRTA